MGWFRDMFGGGSGAGDRERVLQIDVNGSYWAVDAARSFAHLFDALHGWLPDGSILYFEGGFPTPEAEALMKRHAARDPMPVAAAAQWPVPRTFHVALGPGVLSGLAHQASQHPTAQLAAHFHIYHGAQMLLAAYDVLQQDMWLPSRTPKARVADLAARLGVGFRKER
jgi:hypothetical protein